MRLAIIGALVLAFGTMLAQGPETLPATEDSGGPGGFSMTVVPVTETEGAILDYPYFVTDVWLMTLERHTEYLEDSLFREDVDDYVMVLIPVSVIDTVWTRAVILPRVPLNQ